MVKKEIFQANLNGKTISSNSKKAYTFFSENFFGEKVNEKIVYFPAEGFFLFKNKDMKILQNKKKLNENEVIKKFERIDKKFQAKYRAYEELRKKGLILKSGVKYGSDFSVYEKGKKPGKAHSSWLLSVEESSKKINWQEFVLKNRVANSTKKKVLIALQGEDGNLLFYEEAWKKF